jgi:hypothetical protein
MEDTHVKKNFKMRSFVSILCALSFITLPISGFLMHKMRESGDDFGIHLWMGAHNIFSVLFFIAAIFHVKFNWRILFNHMKYGAEQVKGVSREGRLALVIFFAIAGLTVLHAFKG